MTESTLKQPFAALNPGLKADIPAAYLPLETIYQPANVSTRLNDVTELVSLTGLRPEELVAFRPERLALHELIVRVTADIVIPEEDDEEALGRHFRLITRHLLCQYLSPYGADLCFPQRSLPAD